MEFFEDLIEKSPETVEKIKFEEAKTKNVQFITGDPAIDKLEEIIAKGEEIPQNINEMLLGEQNAKRFNDWLARKSAYDSAPDSGGFSVEPAVIEEVEEKLKESPLGVPFFSSEES